METGEATQEGFGDGSKLYQRRARLALPILVRLAKAHQTILYSELGEEMGVHHRLFGHILGAVGGELRQLSKRSEFGNIPPIQCIVLNKKYGLPGRGIGWFVDKRTLRG